MTDRVTPLWELRKTVKDALKLPACDLSVVDYIVALAVSNTCHSPCEPVWGFLCGPPASAKTECLRPLQKWSHTIFVDELSMNSLASGYEDEDGNNPSLLPMLNHNVLLIKDFTTMIQAPPIVRNKIMGSLRSAFDDNFAKADGKSGLRQYQCRFGCVAAVTGVLDDYLYEDQQLGQRFVIYRFRPTPGRANERKSGIVHVLQASATKKVWREHMERVFRDHLDDLRGRAMTHFQKNPSQPIVTVTEDDLLRTADISDLAVRLRTRSHHSGKPAESEFGARFAQQLLTLMQFRAFADNRPDLDDTDFELARRIARDSMPAASLRLLRCLYRGDRDRARHPISGHQAADWASVDLTYTYDLLRQMTHLGILEIPEEKRFRLTGDALDQIESTRILHNT